MSKRITRAVYLEEDIKGKNGEWLLSRLETVSPNSYIQYHSLSGKRYRALVARCNPKSKDYQGSTNCFDNFHSFVEWSRSEVGYIEKEGNKFWAIDKDILGGLSKEYSEENCLFVPQRINNLFLGRSSSNNKETGLGVSWDKSYRKYQARCPSGGASNEIFLGFYDCPREAHKVWQLKRTEVLTHIALEFKNKHRKLYDGIMNRVEIIKEDIRLERTTHKY